MKELVKLIVVMTLVSLISGLLLAVTHVYTKEPIRQTEERQLFDTLRQVLPPSDGDPVPLMLTNAAGQVFTNYIVRKDGAFAGVAFASTGPGGYGGPVVALLGLNADGVLHGLEIVRMNETPGLGSKIGTTEFRAQFAGKPLEGSVWKVRKDGGPIDAVTGATISSRALCDAVSRGLALYLENKQAIVDAASATPAKEMP